MVPLRETNPHYECTSRAQRSVQSPLPRPTWRGLPQRRAELVRRRRLGRTSPVPTPPKTLETIASLIKKQKQKCYWSLQDGNETSTWSDARLTQVGRAQAQTAHDAWRKQIETAIPFPEMFYVSPLNRCLETAFITFDGLVGRRPFRPTVKEVCTM